MNQEEAFEKVASLKGSTVTWNATYMPVAKHQCRRFFFEGAPRAFEICAKSDDYWKKNPLRPHARVKFTGRLMGETNKIGRRAKFELVKIAPLDPLAGPPLALDFQQMKNRAVEKYHGKRVSIAGKVKYPQTKKLADGKSYQEIQVQVGSSKQEIVRVSVYGRDKKYKWGEEFKANPVFDGVETCVGKVCGVLLSLDAK